MERQRLKRILALALPIVVGMFSQNLLALVDTAMVGTQGSVALAAVGVGGFALFMCHALLLGVATGVQALAARRQGEGRPEEAVTVLNAALLAALVAGPLFSLALYFVVPQLYPLLNADPAVVAIGVEYMSYPVLASTFLAAQFAFRGYWMAVDRPGVFLLSQIAMHGLNILLNWMLIFGHLGAPAMGAPGAGLATALAMAFGALLNLALGARLIPAGFLARRPPRETVRAVVRLSLPPGVQQLFVAAGITLLLWIVGRVGTEALAAASVIINVMLAAILPGIAFGLAAATLVGQALGAGDKDAAHRWAVDVSKVALVLLGAIGLPMWLAPDAVLGVFIHDAATLELARLPMRLAGVTIVLEAINLVYMNALLGAGDVKRVTLVSLGAQWLLFLPLAYLVGPLLGYGLIGIWLLQMAYRAGQGAVFARFWQGRRWAEIRV